jgi:hypothetical protein
MLRTGGGVLWSRLKSELEIPIITHQKIEEITHQKIEELFM